MKKTARKSTGKIKSILSQNTVKRSGTAFAVADASSFPVVGVGASAGGLAAVTEFLKHLPPGVGAAFVLIQHLDPKLFNTAEGRRKPDNIRWGC